MKLKAFFFTAFALLLIHMSAHASTPMNRCSWIGEDSTPLFANCINGNFTKIKRATGLDLSSCINLDKKLTYYFQNCSKNNFRHIAERLRLKFDNCPILGDDVNIMYVSCIQNRFKAIERALP